jgi:hypothetical protein
VGFADVSSWETFDPGEHGVGTDPDGYLGAAFDNQYIYFVPIHNGSGYHGEVLRYDTTVGFTDISSWATFNPGAQGVGTDPRGFANAVFDNRYIYFVPYRRPSYHGEVLRYDTGASAMDPYPADGAFAVDPNVVLSWTPGRDALSHDVYLGTNYDHVRDANSLSDEYQGNVVSTSWDPGGLELATTYYWRIDEVLAASVVKGYIWSFTTSPTVYHVDAVNGDDYNDGLQAETAFATIQKGIEVAEDGDTILVHPGLYQQEVEFVGKAITIQGVVDKDAVPILEFPIAASFVSGEGPDSVLKNFIIQNSYIAVLIVDSSPTLSNLNIMNNDYGIETYADSYPDIANCIFWNNAGSDLYGCEAHHSWVTGGVDPDPLFVDPASGDYHLFSEKGRYWPAHDVWVLDEQTSPCIDAGDPAVDPSAEPMPNGGRINMGVYGGTDYASMSEWPLREDSNRDGVVSMIDLANLAGKWLHQLDWVE